MCKQRDKLQRTQSRGKDIVYLKHWRWDEWRKGTTQGLVTRGVAGPQRADSWKRSSTSSLRIGSSPLWWTPAKGLSGSDQMKALREALDECAPEGWWSDAPTPFLSSGSICCTWTRSRSCASTAQSVIPAGHSGGSRAGDVMRASSAARARLLPTAAAPPPAARRLRSGSTGQPAPALPRY